MQGSTNHIPRKKKRSSSGLSVGRNRRWGWEGESNGKIIGKNQKIGKKRRD